MSNPAQVVVVTGAASGIGRATAQLFHERGARVVGIDISDDPPAADFDQLHADILDPAQVKKVLAAAAGEGGEISALCNIAGGDPRVDRANAWQATVDTNLSTAHVVTACAARFLKPGSAVVNISSLVGIVIGEGPSYSAAKAGIIGLTRAHARQLGPQGVRVNCIAPGVVETPAWGEGGVPDEWVANVPLGRCAQPIDIARVVAFLAGPDAGYISGACVVVDGALSTALGPAPAWLPPIDAEL